MDTDTATALHAAHRHHKHPHPHGWISMDKTSALALIYRRGHPPNYMAGTSTGDTVEKTSI